MRAEPPLPEVYHQLWQVHAGAGGQCSHHSQVIARHYESVGRSFVPSPPTSCLRYRYHVTVFQNMAYLVLLDKLSKVQEPHKQQVAASLALPEDVLYALDVLESVQGRDDDYANAYKSAFGWVKTVWDAIVQGLGLSTKEYEALVEFKKKGVIINEYEEDDQEEEAKAKESLQALQSSTAPVLVAYKEPLTRLLQVLLGA